MEETLFYNPQKMLSYNRILNFVIGARGIGKSYSMKDYPINRFIKHGEQFIYTKRYKGDLKKVGKYFDDIKDKYPEHEFKVKGKTFYIDGKECGYAIPLSTWQNEKSTSYPNVTTIIMDEFIREKDNSGYIPNEVDALLNLMDTVFRTREKNVRCICLSNAVTIVNPYFLYFKLFPDVNKRFNSYDDILIEIPDSKDFADERKKTRFGKLISKTPYGEMSLDNNFVGDSDVFIERRTKESKFQFSVIFEGMIFGIWYDVEEGVMYLSHKYDPSSKLKFALSKDDMSETTLLTSSWKTNYYLKKMVIAFTTGVLRFEDQILRNKGYDMFNKMHIY